MAKFTVLTRELVQQIIDNYEVGGLRSFKPLDGGLANSSVRVDTESGRYVLSVCDEKDFAETSRLCSVLRWLEQARFPATRVVAARDGRLYLEHDGKPVYLKRYIEGEVVSGLDAHHLHQVGGALARLHLLTPPAGLPDRFSYGVESFDEIKADQANEGFAAWLMERRRAIIEACSDGLPRGFVHGDLFFDNMLFAGGRLAALLDFEEACNYFLVFDIGMAAIGCCVAGGSLSFELTAALLAGYQRVRPLEPLERTLLQRHVEYGAAATSFWRYRQYRVRNPDVRMRDHYRAMQGLARQVAALDADRFIAAVFG